MGQNAIAKMDYPTAIEMYSQAIEKDSNFYFTALEISITYGNQGLWDSAIIWCLKVYEKRDQMAPSDKIWTNLKYTQCFETPIEQIKCANQFLEIDDQQPIIYYMKGVFYNVMDQFDKSIPELEKSLETYNKWDSKSIWALNYTSHGRAYHETGQYKIEKELYKKAEQDFPDEPRLINR